MERGRSKLEGTLAEQLQQAVDYLRAMLNMPTVSPRVLCTLCQQAKGECDVCSVPITSMRSRKWEVLRTEVESDENEEERVEWGTRKYGVRMSPAHPGYVGRGDDTCGGEVVYTIQEIRTLLRSQPEDAQGWLTTGQMGWALTREENEVIKSTQKTNARANQWRDN